MKQPELGKKINEIRNQKGITQKELADACTMDIRTIQRIESGEVAPRMSSLKLISDILEIDLSSCNENAQKPVNSFINKTLLITLIAGVINLLNWIIFTAIILPKNNMNTSLGFSFIIIYVVGGVLYNYGFYELGKYYGNKTLQFASLVGMITGPLFYITFFISATTPFIFMHKFCQIISGINAVIFGIGLLKANNQFLVFYKIAGVLQILIVPFLLLPVRSINIIGSWISIPFLISLLLVVFNEYKKSTETNYLLLSD